MSIEYRILSDDELMEMVERARNELSNRYPFDPDALQCPKCGTVVSRYTAEAHFFVSVYVGGVCYRRGETEFGEPGMDDPVLAPESACWCPRCEYSGEVYEFHREFVGEKE